MALTEAAAALIAAGISAAGTAGNAAAQASMNKKTREWNVEQWNRQNDYNSPSAQMDRLSAAGLNPNLVYGSGGSGMLGNTSTAPAPAFGVDLSDMATKGLAVMNIYGQMRNIKRQDDLAAAEIYNRSRETDASVALKNASAENMRTTNLLTGVKYLTEQYKYDKNLPYQTQILGEQLKKAINFNLLFGAQKQNLNLQNDLLRTRVNLGNTQNKMQKYQLDYIYPQNLMNLKLKNYRQHYENKYILPQNLTTKKLQNLNTSNDAYYYDTYGISPGGGIYNAAVRQTFKFIDFFLGVRR